MCHLHLGDRKNYSLKERKKVSNFTHSCSLCLFHTCEIIAEYKLSNELECSIFIKSHDGLLENLDGYFSVENELLFFYPNSLIAKEVVKLTYSSSRPLYLYPFIWSLLLL